MAVLALALATFSVGCGGDGNGEVAGPEDDFLGTWWIQETETNFRLSCPYVQSGAQLSFFFWTELTFERGESSDLVALSEECFPGLHYDLNEEGTAARATSPDPFTGLPPTCGTVVYLPSTPPEYGILELLPADGWTFTLRPKVEGQPREADLGGTAPVRLTTADAAGLPVVQEPCTYTGTDRFVRITRD